MFGSSFDRITQVWGWDSSGAQRYVGYDIAAIPQVKELTGVSPGRGYWVYALEPVTLTPNPALILTPDADLAPLAVSTSFTAADSRWRGSNPASYFTDGLVIGTKEYVDELFRQNKDLFGKTRKTGARKMKGAEWG